MRKRIAILGDGGWGTAISLIARDAGHETVMWGHEAPYLAELVARRENHRYLPGIQLPSDYEVECDMAAACRGVDLVVSAVPTKFLRRVFAPARGKVPADVPVVSLTKGIEQETLQRPSEILRDLLGVRRVAVLSGPSHAEEVARRLPCTVTVAADDAALAQHVQDLLITPSFRIYSCVDVIGVELGGALKNVIALAAGIVTGLGLGDNALAALVTRGLAEISRLGVALGAEAPTFAGLSGMGDLITTCVSPHGRNRRVGMELGQGRTLQEIEAGMEQVAEGVHTALSACDLARRASVEMPIVDEVCRILYEGKDPRQSVADLMSRDSKPERPGGLEHHVAP